MYIAAVCLCIALYILRPWSSLPFYLKEQRMVSPAFQGVLVMQHGRWFVGGRVRNVCYWDGTRWFQAPQAALRSIDIMDTWLQSVQVSRVVR